MPDSTSTLDRRDVLTMLGGAGLAALASSAASAQSQPPTPRPGAHVLNAESLGWDAASGEYVLPKLPYAYDALEPVIDAQTMEIHHSKHHAGYVKGLNAAIAAIAKIRDGSGDISLIKHWERELAFNGGGHVNHSLFWLNMAPPNNGGGGRPSGALAAAIDRDFGSFDSFSKMFLAAANSVEASGWGWLVYGQIAGRLMVQQMEKQQNMLITGVTPLLGIDVWEHAYYLKYQNRRADYTKAWMNVINWPNVEKMFEYAASRGT
jgi:Fe-Mn family superoxide dismutase